MKKFPSGAICFFLFLTACCPQDQEKKKEIIQEEPEEKFVLIIPVDSTGQGISYDLCGFSFLASKPLKIKWEEPGVDFVVPTFMNASGLRFHCYFGYHPSYPDPIRFQLDNKYDLVPGFLSVKDSLAKNGSYYERILTSFEDGYNADSTIRYRQDSMIFEVFRLQSKDIWIRKPLERKAGPVDIGVIFHADSVQTRLHLFAEARNGWDAKYLVDLARKIEKR